MQARGLRRIYNIRMDRSVRSIVNSLRRDSFEKCRAFLAEVYDELKSDRAFLALVAEVYFEQGEYRALLANQDLRQLLDEEVMVKVLQCFKLLQEYDQMLEEARSLELRVTGLEGFGRLRAAVQEAQLMMKEYAGEEMQETKAQVDRMVAWLQEGGAKLNKVTVCYFSHNYRGIRLTAATQIAEDLLYIPQRFIITYHQALDCDALRQFRAADLLDQLR